MAINFLFGWASGNNIDIPKKSNGETDIGKLFEMYNNEMNNLAKKTSPEKVEQDLFLKIMDKDYLQKMNAEEIKKAVSVEIPPKENKFADTYSVEKLYGKEFKGYKGQDAVNKLLQEKQGHVKGAFHRNDIGDIDLVWGNDDIGVQHICKRRTEQGIDTESFFSNISDVVEKGSFRKTNNRGNFEIIYNGKIAVVAPDFKGEKLVYLLTAFKTHSKK